MQSPVKLTVIFILVSMTVLILLGLLAPGVYAAATVQASFAPLTPVTRALYPNIGYPGSCVWYALHERPDIPPTPVPYAYQLAHALAIKHPGYHQGLTPQLWALAVFAPGIQGANKVAGHIALVIAVNAHKTAFEVAEMAAPNAWVVSYAWKNVAKGISFIY